METCKRIPNGGEGGYIILSNGDAVEVSRRKKDLLMTKMKEFYNILRAFLNYRFIVCCT
jgi:hypothetical protein